MILPGATFEPTPEHEAAMTWAASLALRLEAMKRPEILAEWNGDVGQAYRATLKVSGQAALRQLVGHVRERLADIDAAVERANRQEPFAI